MTENQGATAGIWFRVLVPVLILFIVLQAMLSIDTVLRLLTRAASMESGNLLLLLFYELMRVLRDLLGLFLVVLLLRRSAQQQSARALVVFLLFGLIAYDLALSGSIYVGPFQEWLTGTLLGLGLPREWLRILFGFAGWAVWLALAALLRVVTLFPTALSQEAVAHSGTHDRSGLMRGVPGAGVDVGSAFRGLAGLALRRNWLAPVPVWTFGLLGAAASIALRGTPWGMLLALPFFLGFALAITCMRAGYVRGDADARMRLLWITRGALAALACYALSGVVGILEGVMVEVLGFVLLTLTPVALLYGVGMAVLQRNRSENVAPALSYTRP